MNRLIRPLLLMLALLLCLMLQPAQAKILRESPGATQEPINPMNEPPAPAHLEVDGVRYELIGGEALILGFAEGIPSATIHGEIQGLPTTTHKEYPLNNVPELIFAEGVVDWEPYEMLQGARIARVVVPSTFDTTPEEHWYMNSWLNLFPWAEEIVFPANYPEENLSDFAILLYFAYDYSAYELLDATSGYWGDIQYDDLGHRALTHLRFPEDHPTLYDLDGVVFHMETNALLLFPPARSGAYTVPEGTTAIATEAFKRCDMLESITFPRSLTHIGEWAFSQCASLRTLQLPPSLVEIGKGAFANCISLTHILLPDGVAVRENAFRYCTSLRAVYVQGRDSAIAPNAFNSCSRNLAIYAPEGSAAHEIALANGFYWAEIGGSPQRLPWPYTVHTQPAFVHSALETDRIPLRETPDAAAPILTSLEVGATVDVLRLEEDWAYVTLYQREGYMPTESLLLIHQQDMLERILEVQAEDEDVLLYAAPSLDAPSFPVDDWKRYRVIERFGSWYVLEDDEELRYVQIQDMKSFSMGMELESLALALPSGENKRVTLYAEPSTDSACLGVFYCGTQLELLERIYGEESFCHVAVEGLQGYMRYEDVSTVADVWFYYAY